MNTYVRIMSLALSAQMSHFVHQTDIIFKFNILKSAFFRRSIKWCTGVIKTMVRDKWVCELCFKTL